MHDIRADGQLKHAVGDTTQNPLHRAEEIPIMDTTNMLNSVSDPPWGIFTILTMLSAVPSALATAEKTKTLTLFRFFSLA